MALAPGYISERYMVHVHNAVITKLFYGKHTQERPRCSVCPHSVSCYVLWVFESAGFSWICCHLQPLNTKSLGASVFLIWMSFDLFLKVPSSLLPLSCLCLGCQYWPLGVIWSILWKSELQSKMDVLAKNRFIAPCSCLISFVRANLQWHGVRGWTRAVWGGEQHSVLDINWHIA